MTLCYDNDVRMQPSIPFKSQVSIDLISDFIVSKAQYFHPPVAEVSPTTLKDGGRIVT